MHGGAMVTIQLLGVFFAVQVQAVSPVGQTAQRQREVQEPVKARRQRIIAERRHDFGRARRLREYALITQAR